MKSLALKKIGKAVIVRSLIKSRKMVLHRNKEGMVASCHCCYRKAEEEIKKRIIEKRNILKEESLEIKAL